MEQTKQGTSSDNRNETKTGTIKKAVQRKLPIIKQTLTSMYRIAKANPLLTLNDNQAKDEHDNYGLANVKLPKSVLLPSTSLTLDRDRLDARRDYSTASYVPKSTVVKSTSSKTIQKPPPRGTGISRTASLRISKQMQLQRSDSVKAWPSSAKTGANPPKPLPHQSQNTDQLTKSKPAATTEPANMPKLSALKKRRSLSAEHYERKRISAKFKPELFAKKKEVSWSLNDISIKSAVTASFMSPIPEVKSTVTFRTPMAYNRRSTAFSTPTPFRATPFASTPRPNTDDLQRHLQEWLRKHRKPVESYDHLKCCGLNGLQKTTGKHEENKENEEVTVKSDSYENLKNVPQITVSDKENVSNDGSNIRSVVQEALVELHKLILDGYSRDQCEAWLRMIRQKYELLEEEPQYWECRAAIEQTRGNLTSAVEYLRNAIVQGAEVKAVDQSLEQLLEKFSLLNISTSDLSSPHKDKAKKDRTRIVLDARNVFKSSIIQFAVQERNLKTKQSQKGTPEKKYVVTPVRRSTRATRSGYVLTPGVHLCTSMEHLEQSMQEELDFHYNTALFTYK